MKNIFLERYKKLGQDIDPDNVVRKLSIRINTLKVGDEDIIKRLKKKKILLENVEGIKHGYRIQNENLDFSLASTPEYLQGQIYIQGIASQIPPIILDPKPNETILDMCAAPGSKTTQLAQLMDNKGKIIALDIRSDRLEALRNNLSRCGVKNTITYNKDAAYANDIDLKFDKILLDAPCSGNFVTDKEWLEKRTLEDINSKPKLQKKLLKSAFSCLKPNGILVYSTCSLEPEEDEFVIDWALKNLDIKLEQIDIKIGSDGLTNPFGEQLDPEIAKTRRLWPNLTNTQGFFIAKIRKI